MIEKNLLLHENDGLILTVDKCPYYPGTCKHVLKWKPLHMNTIDFLFKKLCTVDSQDIYSLNVITKGGNVIFDLFVFEDPQTPFKTQIDSNPSKTFVYECNLDLLRPNRGLQLLRKAMVSLELQQ